MRVTASTHSSFDDTETQSLNIQLPVEILVKIFSFSVCNEGAVPALCRFAHVCAYWRAVARDQSFWRRVDLSSGWIKKTSQGLKLLCSDYLGSHTTSLNVEAWFKLQDSDLTIINDCCCALQVINLSSCEKLSKNTLTILADHFPHLNSVDIANVSPLVVGVRPLCYFLEKKGEQLRRLNLSCNSISRDFQRPISLIYEKCCNLEELVLRHLDSAGSGISLSVYKLHMGCRKLKLLDLESTAIFCPCQPHGDWLLDLESFVSPPFASQQHLVSSVLSKAHRLQTLDLTDCHSDLLEVMTSHKLVTLKYDLVSEDSFIYLQRWEDTLEVLDLSTSAPLMRVKIDMAIDGLFRNAKFSRLKKLILCGNKLSWTGLTSIFTNCFTLKSLNCVRCPHIPRFWSSEELTGRMLQELYRLINQGMGIGEFKSLTMRTDSDANSSDTSDVLQQSS